MSGLVRLAGAGMLCCILLSFGGTSSSKELLRFACACLFAVLCLKALKIPAWDGPELQRYEQELQESVAQAQRQTQDTLLRETESALAEELERQAAAMGLNCSLKVSCVQLRDGVVSAETVVLTYRSGPREQLVTFRDAVAVQLGMEKAHIIVQEEEP